MRSLIRKSGEGIYIYPDYSKISPSTTIGDLFGENGHISISINHVDDMSATVNIEAQDQFSVSRTELEDEFQSDQPATR